MNENAVLIVEESPSLAKALETVLAKNHPRLRDIPVVAVGRR